MQWTLMAFVSFFLAAYYSHYKTSFAKTKRRTQSKLSFGNKRKASTSDPSTSQGEVVSLKDQQLRKKAKTLQDSDDDNSDLK